MDLNRAPSEPHTVWDFVDEFLVECPRCDGPATVRQVPGVPSARLACESCGHLSERAFIRGSVLFATDEKQYSDGQYALGAPVVPMFHLPLWLCALCSGHRLWAYNARHLDFLKRYVSATDRRRARREPTGPRNQLLESRLPKWLKLSKNRDAAVRAIISLEGRLNDRAC